MGRGHRSGRSLGVMLARFGDGFYREEAREGVVKGDIEFLVLVSEGL